MCTTMALNVHVNVHYNAHFFIFSAFLCTINQNIFQTLSIMQFRTEVELCIECSFSSTLQRTFFFSFLPFMHNQPKNITNTLDYTVSNCGFLIHIPCTVQCTFAFVRCMYNVHLEHIAKLCISSTS